ncbi:hypothetical protein [Streptomyces sp. NPDC051677]|uniref:hypothetical protein n=1 Tax=Streptomyces sp. NPDC051677 TaxID=3365669 RepID=UPI0037CE7AD6
MPEDVDGYVVNPRLIKSMHGIGELKEILDFVGSATHLGLGVRLSNIMRTVPDPDTREGRLQETWNIEIFDDVPLDPAELRRPEKQQEPPARGRGRRPAAKNLNPP